MGLALEIAIKPEYTGHFYRMKNTILPGINIVSCFVSGILKPFSKKRLNPVGVKGKRKCILGKQKLVVSNIKLED